ncbi:MAG: archaemetzincin [Planctomycetota bacterium]|jgi:archaemetzincin
MKSLQKALILPVTLLLTGLGGGCGGRSHANEEGDAGEGAQGIDEKTLKTFAAAAEALKPLHEKKRKPGPHDWLARHKERGQTFKEYIASNPVRPDQTRRHLYVVLLGEFTPEQKKVIQATEKYMGLYFRLPVKSADPLDLSVIPESARRVHPSWGVPQINASYVLDDVLKSRVPKDAVALIAFTSSDLWPGPGWNFVFGMASLRERVGVWSIYRNGDPAESRETFTLCLRRTIKTGTHETGHMLGILHCILYECNMNGSNHREESDRTPLGLCPECVRKIWWACRCDPVRRYRELEALCRELHMVKEAEFYKASRERIESLFPSGEKTPERKKEK